MKIVSALKSGNLYVISSVAAILAVALPLQAETNSGELINWMSYDQAMAKAKKENKHVIVNFTTSWCGWCKKMKATTYSDPDVVDAIANQFVAAKVDGESYNVLKLTAGDITEKGLTVQYGVGGYPTTWFLEPNGNKIAPAQGYIDATQMQYVLGFVSGNFNDEMAFTDYVTLQKKLELLRPDAKLRLGMTPAQVKASWGVPGKVEKKTVDKGSVEEWLYGSNQYLIFKDGNLHGFQEREATANTDKPKATNP
ncbi:MAG: DUF255 domain-containing protein [Candidatus Zixiibacteriota bacterium]